MNNNSNGMSTGKALLCTLVIMIFIGWLISLTAPKCKAPGCDNNAKEDSNYCWKHDDWHIRKSYSKTYNSNTSRLSNESSSAYNSESSYSIVSGSSPSSDGVSGSSYSSNGGSGNSSNSGTTKKYYNSMDSYDDGYNDVYEDDDYDWDRYRSDSDYANGVDDAMEDEGEDW